MAFLKVENASNFPLYHSKFDKKVAVWHQNGIRAIDSSYQQLNFRALHTRNEHIPTASEFLLRQRR